MGGMRVLHVAFHDDWEGCERFGEYDVATRSTLYETEGFIHATTSTGVAAVLRDVYGDVSEPLLLAVLDEDALAEAGAAVDWEPGTGGAVPRIRGVVPMDRRTVVATLPLEGDAGRWVIPDLSGLAVRESAPDVRQRPGVVPDVAWTAGPAPADHPAQRAEGGARPGSTS